MDETEDSISTKTETLTSSFTSELGTTRDQITATNSKLIRLDEQLQAIDGKVQTGLLTRNVSNKITFKVSEMSIKNYSDYARGLVPTRN